MKAIEDKVARRIDAAIQGYSAKTGNKLSWAGLAKEIGYTPQAPTKWKQGAINYKVIEKIAEFLGADPVWLTYGSPREEELFIDDEIDKTRLTNPHLNGMDANFVAQDVEHQLLNESFKNTIKRVYDPEKFGDFNADPNELVIPQGATFQRDAASIMAHARPIPLISFSQVTNVKEAETDEKCTYIASYADNASKNSFALVVKDESMAPDFRPGDRIIVDPEVEPNPGDFVIAQYEDHEAILKKYRPRGYATDGSVIFELAPLNPDYPVLNSQDQQIRIIGTVVAHMRALRERINLF